ncbi:MAG: NAD(P)H-quinone oxidoreductase [Rhodospirillaceae bacterium]|nr:NAD(P)H-quinone oxidoreductase [Rhodospirillaceae bacterium]
MNAVPARMKAVEITAPGGPDVLRLGERPVPQPAAGEVLIRVAAAGVNRPDVEQRKGTYPPPPGASDIPGLEIAGTVVALGAGAAGFAVGDQVCALVSGGGYAEYCTAPAAQCLPVPKGMDATHAAALPETYFTVWQNVFDRGRLKAGETILIHGGSSGIGTTAIQMAKAMGARVLATAGSADKCAACVKLGADRAIDYKTEDFVDIAKAETGGKGVDVILDMVGGKYFERNVAALAIEGRLSLIALLGGREAKIDLSLVLRKRLTIVGSVLRARTVAEKGAVAESLRRTIWPLIESGKIAPVIDSTLPLAEANKAHARMESSAHIGKIVLTV